MSQSAKKETFSGTKTSSRLIVLTRGQRNSWSSESQETERPQAKGGPDVGFDRFLLQLVKGKLKQKTEAQISHDCSRNLQQREPLTKRLNCRLNKKQAARLSQ